MTESNGMLAVIEKFASSPDVDVLKLEKMLEMQERIMAKQAEIDFNAAMAELQPNMKPIKKLSKGHNSSYAKYEDIDKEIRPLYTAKGFSVSYNTLQSDKGVIYEATLSHVSGHSKKASILLPADTGGSKNAVQAIGSTTTYARRYLLCMLFNVVTEDEDDDGNKAVTPKTADITAEQVAELTALITKKGTDLAIVLSAYKVAALEHMNADQYAHCKKRLLSTKEKANV